MEQRQYKPSQAAQLLGINAWTMRRWIREGRAPARRSETGRLYVPAAWVDAQTGYSTLEALEPLILELAIKLHGEECGREKARMAIEALKR